MSNVTRKQFITGAAAAATAVTAGLSCGAAIAEEQEHISTADDILGKWSFEIPPAPITDDQIAETIEAEVVVVGAGTAGLVAANSAMENGLDVVLFTASSIPIYRGGSNHAVMSKAKERYGIPADDPRLFERELVNNSLVVDQRKWYTFYNRSEEAMNWLIDIMEAKGYETSIEQAPKFIEGGAYYSIPGAHGFMTPETHSTGMNQQFVVNELADRLEEAGRPVYYRHIGRQLVRDDSGRVVACIAEREDGSYVKFVGTKAIILATGDFSTDRDMMWKYAPSAASFMDPDIFEEETDYDRCFQYGGLYPGDGQKMGLWIGAAWQKIWPCCPMGGAYSVGPVNRVLAFSGLKLGIDGRRIMNEYGIRDMSGFANRYTPKETTYAIWNEDYALKLPVPWINGSVPWGEDNTVTPESVIEGWQSSVASGRMFKADTIEELIEAMGLPETALESVARYNELCAKGVDEDFHKESIYMMPIDKGPFYGQKSSRGVFLCILGGLRTDDYMRVCDANDDPIPGLYNVGTMVGDMFANNYTFEIPGFNLGATCVTFPYLLGKYIAENE